MGVARMKSVEARIHDATESLKTIRGSVRVWGMGDNAQRTLAGVCEELADCIGELTKEIDELHGELKRWKP